MSEEKPKWPVMSAIMVRMDPTQREALMQELVDYNAEARAEAKLEAWQQANEIAGEYGKNRHELMMVEFKMHVRVNQNLLDGARSRRKSRSLLP